MANKIVLGSGKLYIDEAEIGQDGNYVIPADATLEADANLLGYIQGGATLTYTPSYTEVKDDLGIVRKKFLSDEEAVLKSGVLTWNMHTLNKLIQTGTVVDDAVNNKTTLTIGGIGNYIDTLYVIRFVYSDAVDGDVRATIVGSNNAGFELSFQKDKETVVNAEFKAFPIKKDGTLIILEEKEPA